MSTYGQVSILGKPLRPWGEDERVWYYTRDLQEEWLLAEDLVNSDITIKPRLFALRELDLFNDTDRLYAYMNDSFHSQRKWLLSHLEMDQLKILRTAIAKPVKGKDFQAYLMRADLFSKLHLNIEAFVYATIAKSIEPTAIEPHLIRILSLIREGKLKKAEEEIEQAKQIDAGHSELDYLNLLLQFTENVQNVENGTKEPHLGKACAMSILPCLRQFIEKNPKHANAQYLYYQCTKWLEEKGFGSYKELNYLVQAITLKEHESKPRFEEKAYQNFFKISQDDCLKDWKEELSKELTQLFNQGFSRKESKVEDKTMPAAVKPPSRDQYSQLAKDLIVEMKGIENFRLRRLLIVLLYSASSQLKKYDLDYQDHFRQFQKCYVTFPDDFAREAKEDKALLAYQPLVDQFLKQHTSFSPLILALVIQSEHQVVTGDQQEQIIAKTLLNTILSKGDRYLAADERTAFNGMKDIHTKHPYALAQLGFMHQTGRGTKIDPVEAKRCFEKAAGEGDHLGKLMYGLILEKRFFNKDKDSCSLKVWEQLKASYNSPLLRADILFRKARIWHKLDNIRFANERHSFFYEQMVAKETALSAYQNAAELGHVQANIYLWKIYREGLLGQAKDLEKAKIYYKAAIALAQEKSKLLPRTTPTEIEVVCGQTQLTETIEGFDWSGKSSSKPFFRPGHVTRPDAPAVPLQPAYAACDIKLIT